MALAALAVIVVPVVGACDEFEFTGCEDIEGEFRQDTDFAMGKAWPAEEDYSPAPNGPRLESAEFEYLDIDGNECGKDAMVRLAGTDEQRDVSADGLRESLSIFLSAREDGDEIRARGRAVVLDLDGDAFTAEIPVCAVELAEYRSGMRMHVNDDAGNGSNSICARVFARFGVNVPKGPSGGP